MKYLVGGIVGAFLVLLSGVIGYMFGAYFMLKSLETGEKSEDNE